MARPKSQPKSEPETEQGYLDPVETPFSASMKEAEQKLPERPAKVAYKELATALCDQIIDATEGHPVTARYWVCVAALKYALRLIGRQYVIRTRRAA
jgi:hypothetical protein